MLDNGNDWRKFRVVPRSHSLRPLILYLVLIGHFQRRAGIISIMQWNLRSVISEVDLRPRVTKLYGQYPQPFPDPHPPPLKFAKFGLLVGFPKNIQEVGPKIWKYSNLLFLRKMDLVNFGSRIWRSLWPVRM